MRIKKIIKTIPLLTSILLLASCEGGTTFTKEVVNKSSETITLSIHSPTISGVFEIAPNKSQSIWYNDRERYFVDETYGCISEIDSIQIAITNNRTLNKDFLNNSNWTRESKDGRNSLEACTFIIMDVDLD